MKLQRIRLCGVVLAIGMIISSCGGNKVASPFQLGPITRIRAFVAATGLDSVSASQGSTVQLALFEYDSRDSGPSLRGQWITRNPAVASSNGAVIAAMSVGQIYVIAQLTDNGHSFSDSVLVKVVVR